MAIVDVSDKTFEESVLKADKPVLVDFWAEWCAPCRQISPIVAEIAEEFGERIQVAKVNVDENPKAPVTYGVRGIPALMLFKNGEVAATRVGAMRRAELMSWVEENV